MWHRESLRGKPAAQMVRGVFYAFLVWMGLPLSAGAATRLEGRIVDDAGGQPLAARVAVTDVHSKFVEIAGWHAHVEYLGKRWCYVDGSFALTIPEDGASIEIRRGLETLPLSGRIAGGGSKKIEKTFRLRRWIDMSAKGYVNADIHAHLPVPKVAHPQMWAEDLNTLTLLGRQYGVDRGGAGR